MFRKLERSESWIFDETLKRFKNETSHMEEGFNIIHEMICIINRKEKDAIGQSLKRYAVVVLFYRMFRILRSAYWCLLHGYYDITMALLRIAFETHLLMFFLSKREKEAKEWFEGKEFRPAYVRKQVRHERNYDAMYSQMSEFVHPSIHTCLTWFFEDEIGKPAVTWVSAFDPEKAREVIVSLLSVLGSTVAYFPIAFPKSIFIKLKKQRISVEEVINRATSWHSETSKIMRQKLLEHIATK